MHIKISYSIIGMLFATTTFSSVQAATILYEQDFENPAAFVNDGADVNINNSVNTLYGNQPDGFTFAQANTVETLLITGDQAFGTGYTDSSGIGGNYALGMLSSVQNDMLGLSFDIGSNDFLNFSLDISSIDLSGFGGPFVASGSVPTFEFTLFDNPTGDNGLGTGTVLDSQQASGTASDRDTFDWTNLLLSFDATGNTSGNVTLRIDLLTGGYASMDNFIIAASDIAGDITPEPTPVAVPEPETITMLAIGLLGIIASRRRSKSIKSAT